jgi:hypothetical protein
MRDEYIFYDLHGRKIDPRDIRKTDRFDVIDRKTREKIGKFTRKDWERKFL